MNTTAIDANEDTYIYSTLQNTQQHLTKHKHTLRSNDTHPVRIPRSAIGAFRVLWQAHQRVHHRLQRRIALI